jgi:ER lumen protein retaining receptor
MRLVPVEVSPFLLRRVFEISQCLIPNLGISFKSQALYALVFFTRYLDYFDVLLVQIYKAIVCSFNVYPYSISAYVTIAKTLLLTSSCYILYLIKYRYRSVLPSLIVS